MLDHDNLEEFADPVAYDLEDPSDTGVAFYASLAAEVGSPILELACGTGRVAIPLARLGFAVTGLDLVPGMLAQARRKAGDLPVRWVQGDARAVDLGETFRLIFLTGNAFQAFLTRADQAALLRCARAHLAADGQFAFETRNPRWPPQPVPAGEANRLPEADRPRGEGLFAFLETRGEEEAPGYTDALGRPVRVTRSQVYDDTAQLLHWTTTRRWRGDAGEQTRVTRIAVRFTGPQELAALLHDAGFSIDRQYGDWNREPLRPVSPSIITVCRARA